MGVVCMVHRCRCDGLEGKVNNAVFGSRTDAICSPLYCATLDSSCSL